MSFNRGGFNRLPFNRGPVESIFLEIEFGARFDLDSSGIVVDDTASIDFTMSADLEAEPLLVINLEADFGMGFDLPGELVKVLLLEESFGSSLELSEGLVKVIILGAELDSSLDLFGELFAGEIEEALVDIVLNPGDILVINSCQYTITLNGENIYSLYDGDWIHLREKSIELIVDSPSGGRLEVKTDTTPRYL